MWPPALPPASLLLLPWGGAAAAAALTACSLSLLLLQCSAAVPVFASACPSMPRPHSKQPCLAAAETLTADFTHGVVTPNQLRWRPFPLPADNEVRQGAAMSPSWAGLCRACREA